MPVFSYRAINDDGKEVRGSLESLDLETAKSALKDLHLDVIEVEESTRSKPPAVKTQDSPPMQTFAFEGEDASGGVHRGTIQATNKFNAFQKLKNEQQLILRMLAPMGTFPKYNDPDLVEWQKKATPQPTVKSPAATPTEKKKVQFTQSEPVADVKATPAAKKSVENQGSDGVYHPLLNTLVLYAGWLLAWYGIFVALGHYASSRALPWDIPFVQAFYISPFIFTITSAIFFFLMFSAINRAIHGKWIGGILFTILGIAATFAIRMFA